jgi:hypothetical protein
MEQLILEMMRRDLYNKLNAGVPKHIEILVAMKPSKECIGEGSVVTLGVCKN